MAHPTIVLGGGGRREWEAVWARPFANSSLGEWGGPPAAKGWRKLRNFRRLVARARSERQYVFVGDTGERDQEAGEAMLDQFSRPGPSPSPPLSSSWMVIFSLPSPLFPWWLGGNGRSLANGGRFSARGGAGPFP